MAFGGHYRIIVAFVKHVFELTGGCQGELKNGRKRRSRRGNEAEVFLMPKSAS